MFGYNHICKLFRPYLKWMDLFLLICRNPHHVVQQIHGFSYRFLSLNQSIEICWFFPENLQETSAFHWKIHGLPCVSHRFAIDVPLRFGNLQPSPCRHARTSTSSERPWSRWSRRAASVWWAPLNLVTRRRRSMACRLPALLQRTWATGMTGMMVDFLDV